MAQYKFVSKNIKDKNRFQELLLLYLNHIKCYIYSPYSVNNPKRDTLYNYNSSNNNISKNKFHNMTICSELGEYWK